MTIKFWSDFLSGLVRLKDPAAHKEVPRTLPIIAMCGDQDPVVRDPTGGHSMNQLNAELTAAGKACAKVIMYPGARHEIFNETNRDEVTDDLVHWVHNTMHANVA